MKMDVSLINPFIDGIVRTMEMMTQSKPVRTNVYLKDDGSFKGDVHAVMSFTGEVAGTFVLSFKSETACLVVSRMLGSECKSLDLIVMDGICEISNMVSGHAKTELWRANHKFMLGLPEGHKSDEMVSTQWKGSTFLFADFDLEGKAFSAGIRFENR